MQQNASLVFIQVRLIWAGELEWKKRLVLLIEKENCSEMCLFKKKKKEADVSHYLQSYDFSSEFIPSEVVSALRCSQVV